MKSKAYLVPHAHSPLVGVQVQSDIPVKGAIENDSGLKKKCLDIRAGSRQGQEGAWPPQINVVPPQTIIYNISNKRCWSTMPPQDLWLPPHTCLSRPGPVGHPVVPDVQARRCPGYNPVLCSGTNKLLNQRRGEVYEKKNSPQLSSSKVNQVSESLWATEC